LLLQAAENLESKHKNKVNADDSKSKFIHWTFHSKGFQVKELLVIYIVMHHPEHLGLIN
jgi:hypothetical protein